MDAKSDTRNPRYLGMEEAAGKVREARRILVIGCSGGGKSTLSQRLAARFGLDYISIDRDVLWMPGWVQRPRAEQLELIRRLIAGDRWIMDGTNSSTFDIRLPRSDLVLWVHMPRWLCMWGVLGRWMRNRGGTRPEMAPGCPEKLDVDFLRFVWTWDKIYGPRVLSGLETHAGNTPILVLKSRGEMRQLLQLAGA